MIFKFFFVTAEKQPTNQKYPILWSETDAEKKAKYIDYSYSVQLYTYKVDFIMSNTLASKHPSNAALAPALYTLQYQCQCH